MASAVALSGFGDFAHAALAAVFGQVADQAVHMGVFGAIDQVAALLFDGDETGVGQFLQVERQGVAGHVELVGQHAGRESFRAGNDQGAEHAQTLGMRQRAQGGNGLIFVHCSIIQQSLN